MTFFTNMMRLCTLKKTALNCFQYYTRVAGRLQPETSSHVPVMLCEVIEQLQLKSDSIVLDLTFGAGGHSEEILKRYPHSRVIALDRDNIAFAKAKKLSSKYCERVMPLLGRFSEVESLLECHQLSEAPVDAVLIDAGCSSMQFDDGARGFAISKDGPLDMRMDGNRLPDQPTAADVVNTLHKEDIAAILRKYGEERSAERIAISIVNHRPIYTTSELAAAIGDTFSHKSPVFRDNALGKRCHIATKAFMALRIFVNDEMNELLMGLKAAENLLPDGGRLAVLTFHSLEDRIVKRFLKDIDFARPYSLTLKQTHRRGETNQHKAANTNRWIVHQKSVIRPSSQEIAGNNRARSAKLRAAVRNIPTAH